jgi:hypothetical protein
MNFKINNTRELKSLHLINKIKKLNSFLEDSKKCGIFVTTATLHPNVRIDINEQFLSNNLKITKISHKLIKILFKYKSKETFKNLLSGPVYLIEDTLNNLISKDNLNRIFSYKNFTFRFLYLNQQLYRSEEVFILLQNIALPSKRIESTSSVKTKQVILF